MSEEILPPNKPATFEARNMRPRYKRLKAGDIFLVEIECAESVWNQLRTVPENALLEVVLWHHDGDPDPAAKPAPERTPAKPKKEPAGPYGFYWEAMHHKDFTSFPDLQEALNCSAEQVHRELQGFFDTESLSTVSPRQFEGFVTDHGLNEGLITKSRNAEIAAATKIGQMEPTNGTELRH